MKKTSLLIAILLLLGPAASAAPIITNDEIVSIGDDFAIITCQTTNELSLGGVKYGLSLPVSNTTGETGSQRTYHFLVLRNLYPDTNYYYKVTAVSAGGTTESAVRSFKTLERPSGNLLMTFAVMTDLHYSTTLANTVNIRGRPYASSGAIIDALVSNINQLSPSFTVIKGDMLDAATPATDITSLKAKLDNLTAAAGMAKYYPIPGNHDKWINYGAQNWVTGNLGVLYPAGAGLPAGASTFNYSFTYNGCRFIMLDSLDALGVTAEANLVSLEAELIAARTAKQKAFIFLHSEVSEEADIPSDVLAGVLDQATFVDSDWNKIRVRNKEALMALVRNYKLDNGEPVVASVFMGHIHDNRRRDFDGVPYVRTSSGLQFPAGFNYYKVYSNGYVQSFFKLPGYSEEIARPLITGTGEVTDSRAQQFYLGGLAYRNFTHTYSALNTVIPPTVEAAQPAPGAAGVALNQPIIIDFTKPMTKETAVNSWLTVSDVTLSSSMWSWNADRTELTINFSPAASKTYTVTILGGFGNATATDGTFFLTNYTFSFATGTSASAAAPAATIGRIRNEDGLETDVTTDPTPTFSGLATDESGSTIANIEFRHSSPVWSAWQPATPADGAFNSATEPFTFTITEEISTGRHQVQLRTTNAAGVTTSEGLAPYVFYVISNRPQILLRADSSDIVNGDPIHPTPSFEVTVVTDQTLNQLRFIIDNSTPINIMPAAPAFVTTVYHRPTLADGKHDVRVEAVDRDSLGNTRLSTKEAVNLLVQTAGALQVFGTPLNYPNPFNAGSENTSLAYNLSRNSAVTLSLHDLSGVTVARKNFAAGDNGGRAGYNEVAWDGRSDAGSVVGNGIYIYLIIADGKVVARGKLTVLKR